MKVYVWQEMEVLRLHLCQQQLVWAFVSTKENGFGPQVDDCPKAGLNLEIQTELLLQDCSVPPAEDAYTVQVLDLNEIVSGPSVDEKLFWYNCLGGMLTILN